MFDDRDYCEDQEDVPRVNQQKIYRLIDANFNRAKEALRVCEDICRFYLDAPAFTRRYKEIRHKLTAAMAELELKSIIQSRSIESDVGRGSTASEFRRRDGADIYYANSQRAKESVRVLEECAKLFAAPAARKLKRFRYQLYEIEKKVISRI